MIRIYFCGSIRGGRELAATYREIIALIQIHGEVLTEHIGIDSVIDQESLSFSESEIYERDMKWLKASDVVVAEVTVPSLGVGYEIGYAVHTGKPVLCLFNQDSGNQLSAMISGCPDLTVLDYRQPEEINEAVKQFIIRNAPGQRS